MKKRNIIPYKLVTTRTNCSVIMINRDQSRVTLSMLSAGDQKILPCCNFTTKCEKDF